MSDKNPVQEMIERRLLESDEGHIVIGVGDAPPFAYTIGLHPQHGFELLVVGLSFRISQLIFNSIAESLRGGFTIELGKAYEPGNENVWANMPIRFQLVRPYKDEYTIQAREKYGYGIKVYQLVLCDAKGRFPENPDYDMKMRIIQPILYK